MPGQYPILQGQTDEAYAARRNRTPYPRSVSWDLVKDHGEQALSNHSQTLERLAERGGLSPKELWCVVHSKRFYDSHEITEALAIEWLRSLGADVAWSGF